MITLTELKFKQSETEQGITDTLILIKNLIDAKYKTQEEYKLKNKELKRLKVLVKKLKEQAALYKLIATYISSGVQMEGIKAQRNELMVKLASIKEREKIEGISRLFTDKEHKKVINAFESKYKVKKLRTQLKVLNFILK